MDGMTLAQLQQFAAKQTASNDRLAANESAMTDAVSRLVQPTIDRLQKNEAEMQGVVNKLAGPALERTRAAAKRMGKAVLKMAQAPHARSMENAAEMTAILARLQSQGFRGDSGVQSVQGQYPLDSQLVQGAPDPAIGTSFAPTGASGMAMPGAASDTTTGGIGPGLGGSANPGLPNIAGSGYWSVWCDAQENASYIVPAGPQPVYAPNSTLLGTYADKATAQAAANSGCPKPAPAQSPTMPTLQSSCPPGQGQVQIAEGDSGPIYGCGPTLPAAGGASQLTSSLRPALPLPPTAPRPAPLPPPPPPPDNCDPCIAWAVNAICHCLRASREQPVDLDEPAVFRFAEGADRWHPPAIAWYGAWLADYLSDVTLEGSRNRRESQTGPSGLAPFGAEAGGAVGGETTALDLQGWPGR